MLSSCPYHIWESPLPSHVDLAASHGLELGSHRLHVRCPGCTHYLSSSGSSARLGTTPALTPPSEKTKNHPEWMIGDTIMIARRHKNPLSDLKDRVSQDYAESSPVSDD
ncbi:hypothetical protein MHYP_G00007170 [Metynnis hypsauchen]